MVTLNLNQIAERLNNEFAGNRRKLIFWYDDTADFAEDIDSLQLQNAKVLKLEPDTQFQTKYFLERQDTTTNYLVYAPFAKPPIRENHLEDVLLYSKRFYADRASLLCLDLNIPAEYKSVLERHIRYFANKERAQRFYNLQMETYNEDTILIGLMSAICRSKVCSFDEVVRQVLSEDLTDNAWLSEFSKYDVLEAFWQQCERQFDFDDDTPTLPELVATLFVTAADKVLKKDVPVPWKSFVSHKAGSTIAFLDSMKDNIHYQDRYDALSDYVAAQLHAAEGLANYPEEALVECDVFRLIDERLIRWIAERLQHEDTGAALGGYTIPDLCSLRKKMHFGKDYKIDYDLLESAWYLITEAHYSSVDGLPAIIEQYIRQDYHLDQMYRRFYQCYDALEDSRLFEELRELVERIYTNEYLGKLLPKWNEGIQEAGILNAVPLQRTFYDRVVRPNQERTVVIISDAMRYEVGQELMQLMKDDPNSKLQLHYMLSTLPSYTRLGMAALLPHQRLELTDDGRELADGTYCVDLPSRQRVLQQAQLHSCCVQFDEVKKLKKAELRRIFTGQRVIYMYHDQIDVRGEHAEDEVFSACQEAVREIADMIHRIFINGNTYHFIVTADHGFIYKRDKVTESGKISGARGAITKRRYIIASEPVDDVGIDSLSLGYVLGNEDSRFVSFPCSTHVFKTVGGGQHYVHGGSSPQEMILPVLDLKMERGHMDTHKAQITLVSMIKKVTNLNISLDFIQTEPVNDVVKETVYQIYFVDAQGQPISQEQTYVADNRSEASKDRLFTKKFRFKNQKYDRSSHCYLVIRDKRSGLEIKREEVMMDLAFSDDFGFDI